MNAKQIIVAACGILGITPPNSIIGSSDAAVRQLYGILNEEGRDLGSRYAWQSLIDEVVHVTVATEDQGSISTIITAAKNYRYIVNETMFNRSRNEAIVGPPSSVEWQAMKMLGNTGPRTTFRLRGNRLLFLPAPVAGESVAFEIVTRNWCTSADGTTARAQITTDEDVLLIDDEIVLDGVIWRWRKAKGFGYSEDFNTYERRVTDAMTRDGTKPKRSLGGGGSSGERRFAVPAGSWPL